MLKLREEERGGGQNEERYGGDGGDGVRDEGVGEYVLNDFGGVKPLKGASEVRNFRREKKEKQKEKKIKSMYEYINISGGICSSGC